MSMVYVIADLHLGHEKVSLARGFMATESHDNTIVERWNAIVTKRDVVYVLGDVFRLGRVVELKGIKKLALGNHDQKPVAEYAALFSQVRSGFDFDGCLLTHIPVHPSQFARWPINVHGHTHTRSLDDRRYVAVSAEQTRMTPVPLRQLIQQRREELAKKAKET